ncbi:MAG TPA: GNAT family N-acetyltransferase [Arenimonas sp.]|uniref:GNAT family N-acetyltransferase n=1 Tax=Arenimonas sp. TaxID=1872635 RepID=UPI002B8C6BB8|nr:GNAT family N-acetyltransferase [Arenimonas sp.]HMB55809.1 GNAT family N-acetyltransferase [Arenimonas sp.]
MPALRLYDSLDEIPASAWDSLHDGSNPFISHAFLDGLERHQCLREQWGWQPQHAALYEGDELVAAAPGYLKFNSHGEFVFDHAWAHAYARYGIDYYPKWLIAAPYSPVTGPRLLARDANARRGLLLAMQEHMRQQRWSSLHANFLPAGELGVFDKDWLERSDVQFHWRNEAGWRDFDDFLAAFISKKRKNLRAEREQVRRAGISFRIVHGDEARDDDLIDMHAFYCMTQSEKGNHPALSLDFFRHLARTMPRQLLLILAQRDAQTIAGALCLRGGDTLYGRYWGASETLPGLHFETCYYQGIDYCLREGLRVFEPGAQGEHKIARGFMPVLTHSRHFVADGQFSEALRPWCDEERAASLRYREVVLEHSPFRAAIADTPAKR